MGICPNTSNILNTKQMKIRSSGSSYGSKTFTSFRNWGHNNKIGHPILSEREVSSRFFTPFLFLTNNFVVEMTSFFGGRPGSISIKKIAFSSRFGSSKLHQVAKFSTKLAEDFAEPKPLGAFPRSGFYRSNRISKVSFNG